MLFFIDTRWKFLHLRSIKNWQNKKQSINYVNSIFVARDSEKKAQTEKKKNRNQRSCLLPPFEACCYRTVGNISVEFYFIYLRSGDVFGSTIKPIAEIIEDCYFDTSPLSGSVVCVKLNSDENGVIRPLIFWEWQWRGETKGSSSLFPRNRAQTGPTFAQLTTLW